MTVPWYLNVHQAHREIDALISLIKKEFGDTIEFFVIPTGVLISPAVSAISRIVMCASIPLKKRCMDAKKILSQQKKHGAGS